MPGSIFCVAPDQDISLAFFCWPQIPDFGLFAWKAPDAGEICRLSLIWASLVESSTLFRNVYDEQKVHRLCYRIVQFYFFLVRGGKVERKISMSQTEMIQNNWP